MSFLSLKLTKYIIKYNIFVINIYFYFFTKTIAYLTISILSKHMTAYFSYENLSTLNNLKQPTPWSTFLSTILILSALLVGWEITHKDKDVEGSLILSVKEKLIFKQNTQDVEVIFNSSKRRAMPEKHIILLFADNLKNLPMNERNAFFKSCKL